MPWPFCLDVFPWFDSPGGDTNELTGINDSYQASLRGCDVACVPCKNDDSNDFRGGAVGKTAHGSRFLRPDDSMESRSASGRYDWPSGNARVIYVPWQAGYYQLSMCYRQGAQNNEHLPLAGTERWDRNICNCLPQNELPGPATCSAQPGQCIIPLTWAVTVFVHTSIDWPPGNSQIACTGQIGYGSGRAQVRLGAFADPPPYIVRLSTGGSSGCAVHKNAECTGVQEESSSCQLNFGAGGPQPLNGGGPLGGNIANWNRLDVRQYLAAFRTDFNESESDRAITEAKNRVLIWMNQRRANMPPRPPIPDPDNPNQEASQNIDRPTRGIRHDEWNSEWNGIIGPSGTTAIPLSQVAESYATEMDGGDDDDGLQWDGCYLRNNPSQSVRVQYVPLQITVQVVAQWMNWDLGEPCSGFDQLKANQIFPQIRVVIDVQMGVYAKFLEDDGTVNLNDHTLKTISGETVYNIFNDETRGDAGRDWNGAGRFPEVRRVGAAAGDFLDEIVFVDNSGRTIDGSPPDHWQWIGEMGLHRDRTRIYDQNWMDAQSFPTGCCALFRRLATGLEVHAAYGDPIWPRTYHGSLVNVPIAPNNVPDQPGQPERNKQIAERFRTPTAIGYVVVASDCFNFRLGCSDCDSTGVPTENPGPLCGGPGEDPCV